jgi:hypothetical protein
MHQKGICVGGLKCSISKIYKLRDKASSAFFLFMGLRQMSLHVKGKVIGAGKGSLAHFTFEWLGTSMLPVMSGQLIRSSKSPLTLWPMTLIRLFSRMYSLMSLKM